MAVYTEVPFDEAAALVGRLGLGELGALHGIRGGIENTNYFVDTTRPDGSAGRYVLTLFERMGAEELPFCLELMRHLAQRGIPVPGPKADAGGAILHWVQGKPAAVVDRLPGRHRLAPQPAHCAGVGAMLARLHLAAADFPLHRPNPRGLEWWVRTVPAVLPHLGDAQRTLIAGELAFQQQLAASAACAALPRGPIHADLFRDNVMFEPEAPTGSDGSAASTGSVAPVVFEPQAPLGAAASAGLTGSAAPGEPDAPAEDIRVLERVASTGSATPGEPDAPAVPGRQAMVPLAGLPLHAVPTALPDRLCGLFDFYFAGVDALLFDIAVCLNDWCIDLDTGRLDDARATALVAAYDAVRPLTGPERRLTAAMLRAAALRFWLSRLHDQHLPRDASLLTPHDPDHFERVLRERIVAPWHPGEY